MALVLFVAVVVGVAPVAIAAGATLSQMVDLIALTLGLSIVGIFVENW